MSHTSEDRDQDRGHDCEKVRGRDREKERAKCELSLTVNGKPSDWMDERSTS